MKQIDTETFSHEIHLSKNSIITKGALPPFFVSQKKRDNLVLPLSLAKSIQYPEAKLPLNFALSTLHFALKYANINPGDKNEKLQLLFIRF